VSAAQAESTQIPVLARRSYYIPTPMCWSALVVPHGFTARVRRVEAWFGTALRRAESTPGASLLATQLVLEVADVW